MQNEKQATTEQTYLDMLPNLADGGKPTKARAFEMVKELATTLEGVDDSGDALRNLAALYAYFMPAAPKKAKTPFQWVALAMGKQDVRYYLNYVHVTENHIEATDGHRMHKTPNHDSLPAGFYNAAGDKVKAPDFANFPDTGRVTPALMGRDRVEPDFNAWPLIEVGNSGKCFAYRLPNDVHVEKRYLEAALNNPAGVDALYIGASNEAVCIKYKGGDEATAVIMPMRV